MKENFITLPKTDTISDKFALEEDKKKAYQIFAYSALSSIALTVAMYVITQLPF